MPRWPPEGYSEPIVWEKSEKAISAIAAVIGILFFYLTRSELQIFGEMISELVISVAESLRISNSFFGMFGIIGVVAVLFGLFLYLSFRKFITPIHERIHYEIDRILGLNPEYTHDDILFLQNPAVVPVSSRITLLENTITALGPFIVIGVVSGVLILFTGGLLAGISAFVLLTNSAASAGDIYNVIRFIRMPRGTLFANFKDGPDEYRTEYVIPER